VNQALFKKLSFDPVADLVPILLIERGPLVLMVRTDSPYKTVKDLVAAAKAAPGHLAYASGGIGGTHHLSGALFEAAAGIDMVHAPYKSGAAGATDLMGGQVHAMFEQMYAAMPSIKGGRLRPLAITSKTRAPLFPDIPTMAEAGYPTVEVLNWQGIVGPRGLPADIVALLNRIGNKALQDKEQRELMLAQGNEIAGGTPQDFATLIAAERPRWAKVVRDAKIEPE
jgi:tripartite-type tricarboxylate transporter receptor subunit TctC